MRTLFQNDCLAQKQLVPNDDESFFIPLDHVYLCMCKILIHGYLDLKNQNKRDILIFVTSKMFHLLEGLPIKKWILINTIFVIIVEDTLFVSFIAILLSICAWIFLNSIFYFYFFK